MNMILPNLYESTPLTTAPTHTNTSLLERKDIRDISYYFDH